MLGPEQLEAADMSSGQNDNWIASVDSHDQRTGEVHVDVRLAGRQRRFDPFCSLLLDILHVIEPLAPKQLFGNVLWSLADAGNLYESKPRRFRRGLCGGQPWLETQQSRGSDE